MDLDACRERAQRYYTDLPYHTFSHAETVLEHAESLLDRCERFDVPVNKDVVQAAVLFHDAGYHHDPETYDEPSKEQHSAAIARDELEEMGGNEAAVSFLQHAVDVRYFGATCSFSSDFQSSIGDGFPGQFIGPVQFSHARSLNTVVQKSESKQLSTVVSSSEDAEQGTFATDNRLQYALIPFHGIVNEVAAEDTLLSESDVERLDSLLWRSVKNQTLTRSKMGHQPRLYLRVEYDTDEYHIGTLDDGLTLTGEIADTELRNITDVTLNIDGLIAELDDHSPHIETVHYTANRHLTVEAGDDTGGPDVLVEALEDAVGADSVEEHEPYA